MTPEELIQNLGDLPPLPQVATRVIRISAASNTSSDELKGLISTDQALSAQVLRIANSAMFGMMREVTTLTQAILTLGFSTTRSVVLASSVKNLFNRGPAGHQERIRWEHSLVAAITGASFSKTLQFSNTEEVFLGGLLHDIGKSVLSMKFPERYSSLLQQVQDQGGDGNALELDTFGFDHAMVGESLLESWNLPEATRAAVRWHHNPFGAGPEHHRLVALVALGNQLAMDVNVGLGNPDSLAGATWEAMDILKLDSQTYQEHRAKAMEALEMDKALITDF
jgi:putative nucleotidyltransferase with HDIG domain